MFLFFNPQKWILNILFLRIKLSLMITVPIRYVYVNTSFVQFIAETTLNSHYNDQEGPQTLADMRSHLGWHVAGQHRAFMTPRLMDAHTFIRLHQQNQTVVYMLNTRWHCHLNSVGMCTICKALATKHIYMYICVCIYIYIMYIYITPPGVATFGKLTTWSPNIA